MTFLKFLLLNFNKDNIFLKKSLYSFRVGEISYYKYPKANYFVWSKTFQLTILHSLKLHVQNDI